MDGYSYTDQMAMQEMFPMLTDNNRDMNESSDKHEIEQPDLTELSIPMVLF